MIRTLAAIAIAALMVGLIAACGGQPDGTSLQGTKIGTPVTDSPFEFTVTGVDRSDSIGYPPQYAADGQEFVNVHVTLRNITSDSVFHTYAADRLLVVGGDRYLPDEPQGLPKFTDGTETIAPHSEWQGIAHFAIPSTATPDLVLLHGTPGSKGALLSVR